MKKIILPIILAATLTTPINTSLENKLEVEDPIGIEHLAGGFSKNGACAIVIAENKVSKKYYLPEIIYVENEYANKISDKLDLMFGKELQNIQTKENEMDKPYEFKRGEYMIIMENFKRQELDSYLQSHYPDKKIKPLDERFSVQDELSMVGKVIHNIGHTYYEELNQKSQIEIVAKFQSLDRETYKKNNEKIYGHPSLLSYYSSIPFRKNIDINYALTNTSEQFAEIFTYHILNYDYKENDNLFNKKLEILKEKLELFSKD
ncbi:hypothetical protein HN706_00255 [Candidatus Woesearchaeota archaeon]|nr:hypothetical protein [Candidatus Woesearchaeota archaeon]MBT7170131.1 hypothetical protein [Candidatus Woesearchaeota archaeon]MBT7474367.1 hypothetical protein [Candidatus Woesearchaeota archaeon]